MQVLRDPLAQELLQSSIPVRLADTGSGGLPRVVPLGFHWNGAQFVICTIQHSPKVRALETNPNVAMTIDTNTFPPHVLWCAARPPSSLVDGVPPEYLEASRKQVGDQQMPAFEAQVRALYKQMVRIAIVPEWAKLWDFETRLPSPVAQLIQRQQVPSR